MSMNVNQLIELIIRPALKQMDAHNSGAEQLVVGTCAKESALGFYVHQLGEGPALGIFQMEPATYDNLWNQYLVDQDRTKRLILSSCGYSVVPPADRLITDFKLAAMMCRARYLWVSHPLPNFGDINGQATYWAKYYNGNPITGVPSAYVEAYTKLVGGYYAK
jgi:hypothetical protein